MRKIIIVLIFWFALFTSCEKKQEQPVPTPIPSAPQQVQNEIRFLQDAAKHDPNNVEVLINLGNLLMDTERYPEAVDAYEKALALTPENEDVRVDMGTCYRRIGMSDRAADEFRKAISINPLHPNAHRNLGIVLAFDLHDRNQAIKELEEYIRLAPDTPDANQIRQIVSQLKSEPVK